MLQHSEAKLDKNEIKTLQDFLWAGDVNDDGEISYGEFVDRFSEFVAQLRPGNIKAESHKALGALADSDLMSRLFKYHDEFLQNLARESTHSMRMVTAEELTAALKKMKQMKFSDDECEWLAVAANTFGRDRFDPVALIEMAAVKRGVELDLANRDFRRAVAIGVEETHLDAKTMAEFKARAMQLQKKVGPLIHKIMEKIGEKTGDSLQRAFRALDFNKSGVLTPEDLVQGFKNFDLHITDETANDIVGACDINQDGHVAFADFQQFFQQDLSAFSDLEINRRRDLRPKAVPSQLLQSWAGARRGGAGQAAWLSQFHQGDWQGPFKGNAPNAACTLQESERFKKKFAPQYVDTGVLVTFCRTVAEKAGKPVSPNVHLQPDGTVRGLSPTLVPDTSVEFERFRAKELIQQARLAKRAENMHRIEEKKRIIEHTADLRDQANIQNRSLTREDWMQRCNETYLSFCQGHGKQYREPAVRHAFYAPTKLHYYPEGQYNAFDRGVHTGGKPQLFGSH